MVGVVVVVVVVVVVAAAAEEELEAFDAEVAMYDGRDFFTVEAISWKFGSSSEKPTKSMCLVISMVCTMPLSAARLCPYLHSGVNLIAQSRGARPTKCGVEDITPHSIAYRM